MFFDMYKHLIPFLNSSSIHCCESWDTHLRVMAIASKVWLFRLVFGISFGPKPNTFFVIDYLEQKLC